MSSRPLTTRNVPSSRFGRLPVRCAPVRQKERLRMRQAQPPNAGAAARKPPAISTTTPARKPAAGSSAATANSPQPKGKQKVPSLFANMRAMGAAKAADRRQGKLARSAQDLSAETKRGDLNIFAAAGSGSLFLLKDLVAKGQPLDAVNPKR